jgi:hypothetical protein
MRSHLDDDLYHNPPGMLHYNIRFTSGALLSRTDVRAFRDLQAEDIDWVWIVEEGRRATPEEIRRLCGTPGKIPPKRAV